VETRHVAGKYWKTLKKVLGCYEKLVGGSFCTHCEANHGCICSESMVLQFSFGCCLAADRIIEDRRHATSHVAQEVLHVFVLLFMHVCVLVTGLHRRS